MTRAERFIRACYLGAMVIFLLLPIAVVVAVSFSNTRFLIFPPHGFSLKWFSDVLSSSEFLWPLWNSIRLALLATTVATILVLPCVVALVRLRPRFTRTLEAVILAPLSLPTIILAIGLLFFSAQIALGGSFAALVAGHTVIVIPYMFRTCYAVYIDANAEMEEAARTLGAGPVYTFWRISLPLIRPGIIAGGIFAFLMSFNEVPVALFLTNTKTTTLPVYMLSYLVYNYDPGVAAISTVQIVVVIVGLFVLDRLFGVRRIVEAR